MRSPIEIAIDRALGITPEQRAELEANSQYLAKNNAAAAQIIEGLLTDGAHHKQWCLVQALKALGGYEAAREYLATTAGYEWDEGTPP